MATAPVNLGLIGLGPRWDSRYRPAIASLSSRLRVTAVYDSVLSRADQAARELGARAVTGIGALAERPDVQGVLCLDAGWPGVATLWLLAERLKPTLLTPQSPFTSRELDLLCAHAKSHSWTVVPAFPRRCTPASNRLQELLATHLGRPLRIEIGLPPGNGWQPFATAADLQSQPAMPGANPWLDWIDWCHYLFRAAPQQVQRAADQSGFHLEFAPPPGSDSATFLRTADLSIITPPPSSANPSLEEVHIQCERGEARLLGATNIEWTTESATFSETLATERTETEVLLDHFCRRVVGGLIPVPDLHDLCLARRVTDT